MRSSSVGGRGGSALFDRCVCSVGFHRRSLSLAGHMGRSGDGVGVRSDG